MVKNYVYDIIESLSYNWDDSETFKSNLNSSKEIFKKCKDCESKDMPCTSLTEIKKILPYILISLFSLWEYIGIHSLI